MNEHQYYSISYRGDEELGKGPFTYLDEDLINAEDGIAFDLFVPDPSLKKAKGLVVHRRKKLPDLLFFTCATWFVISPKALAVVQQVRCCKSIRWVPTAICHKDGSWIADYWLAYEAMEHDIWDYRQSDFYWIPGRTPGTPEAAGYMRRGVLKLAAVPVQYDFFRATKQKWIGSRRLRDLVASERLTQFEFNKIDTQPTRA
jgi:hypothetical protein